MICDSVHKEFTRGFFNCSDWKIFVQHVLFLPKLFEKILFKAISLLILLLCNLNNF